MSNVAYDLQARGEALRTLRREQDLARQELYAKIINARTMGLNISAISKLSGLSRRMVKKVLDLDAQKE